MVSFIESDGPDQQFLLPPDAREWLPPQHVAWRIVSVVEELDTAGFEAAYRGDGRSRPAYHPQTMVGLIMYCLCKGIRSSRAIEMATYDDLGARVVAGQLHPDHATIARFISRHHVAIKQLLVQTLVMAANDGMLRLDVVAGDGTVVKANASMACNVDAGQLDIDIDELERLLDAEVESWFDQAQAADADDDALFDTDPNPGAGDGRPPSAGKDGLWKITRMLARRHQAQEKMDTRDAARRDQAQAKAEAAGAKARQREQAARKVREAYQAKVDDWYARNDQVRRRGGTGLPGTRPVPVDEHTHVRHARESAAKAAAKAEQAAAAAWTAPQTKVNTTDPHSRVMPAKHGGYQQSYNLQVLADRGQFILWVGTHDNPTDVEALHPALRGARANLDAAGITEPIGHALFDAGYASDTNFTTACPDPDTTLLVAVKNEARQTGRRDSDGGRDHQLESWQHMAHRLDTDHGKNLYRKRGAIIEPVFGQWFNRLGKHLYHRGHGVNTELHLAATSHNLLKIFTHRTATAT